MENVHTSEIGVSVVVGALVALDGADMHLGIAGI
jgi:hypothetical protein